MAGCAKSGQGGAPPPRPSQASASAGARIPPPTLEEGDPVDDHASRERTSSTSESRGGRPGGSTSLAPEKRQSSRRAGQAAPAHPDPQHQLSDYRQRLAREMSARVNSQTPPPPPPATSSCVKRPSPIEEETVSASGSPPAPLEAPADPTARPSGLASTASASPPTLPSAASSGTASAESTHTVRASESKGSTARTPSYPFPRMAAPGAGSRNPSSFASTAAWAAHAHSPQAQWASDSEKGAAGFEQPRPGPQRDASSASFRSDQALATPSTPASTIRFLPASAGEAPPDSAGARAGHSSEQAHGGHSFETPNLYELSLALSSEPGLDSWWTTVVQIATQWYSAERVTLAIPSDSTDVENMPWGQKATFKKHDSDDDLSLGYMGRDGSLGAGLADLGPDSSSTPLLSASGILSPSPVPAASPLPPNEQPRRPSLAARYSYTTYEEQKENNELREHTSQDVDDTTPPAPVRPALSRRQTSQPIPTQRSDIPQADAPSGMLPPKPYAPLNHTALEEHDAVEERHGVALADVPSLNLNQRQYAQARVLPVLQALDYEADPLLDHNGVQHVLDRGRVVALTRSYPYISPSEPEAGATEPAPASSPRPQPPASPESKDEETMANTNLSRLANELANGCNQRLHHEALKLAGRAGSRGPPPTKGTHARPSASYMRRLTDAKVVSRLEEAKPRAKSPLYEEYEQMPPSPWSHSPAPSPATRHDVADNPFFRDAVVDEDSFNPSLSPNDFTDACPPEAIGLDNAWTVLHIPLYHPLLSKTTQPFRLDTSKMERRSSPKRGGTDNGLHTSPEASPSRPRQMPIAILSILSPVIPYPSNLRHSLEHLAPHMATSFSLCAHYSGLEAEISGLNRRRHETNSGFGGLDTDGHPLPHALAYVSTPFSGPEGPITNRSQAGSLTSFSDYSARSRSIAGSPGGTPAWDPAASSTLFDKRANAGMGVSPGIASLGGGDGYFGMRTANAGASGRPATTPGGGGTSSSGGGAGANGGQRGRKNSVSHSSEKRLSALRLPEVAFPAQDGCLADPAAASASASAVSSATRRTEEPPGKGPGAVSTEPGLGSSAEAALPGSSQSHSNSRPGHLAPAALADHTNQPPADPKKRAVERDPVVSEELRLAFGSQTQTPPLLSPMPPTPGSTQHPRRPRFQHQHSHSHGGHSQLHSYGADFASTFPSLPPSGTIAVKGASAAMPPPTSAPSGAGSGAGSGAASGASSSSPVDMPPPSDRLKSLILDSLPAHVFVALPQTGAIVWVNSRYLAYRGQTVEGLAEDPWGSLHPDDRDEYLKAWSHSVRTGDQFSRTVRIRRFDGSYRWFQARAVASRDRRNSIMQFLGSYMDIHDQYIAELKAARQEEIEVSETKHRILANLIPQIIFTANEEEGVTFANEQWLSYTGQSFKDLLGLGFLDSVHPDDLAKCSFLPVPAHLQERRKRLLRTVASSSSTSSARGVMNTSNAGDRARTAGPSKGNDEDSGEDNDEELSELAGLARRGVILVTTDDNGRPSYTTEVRLRSKTGEYRWHLVRCVETGTMDFGKGYNSYFGSATDINDHKLLETKLKEAMDSKTRFLSNMSHEIRTPLIGISGMVSFLQDTVLDEEQRDYTNTIQTSANSLLMIINDILDLSKVDAGMMKLSFEWFHTRSLIEDVNELVSTMAIAKRLELNYIVDDDVPSWVKGDRVRIRQVLLNVIGNAIKFTAQGEVFSRCRVAKKAGANANAAAAAADQIELEFSVTDTGRGFTKEEADLIFKPFSQIDGSSTRQHGGSGLGLVISRQLVELHGGTMNGSAVPGKGSTFTFTAIFRLPTELDHPDGLSTPSSEAAATAPSLTLSTMGLTAPSFMDPAAIVAAAAASAAGAGSTGTPSGLVDVHALPASPAGGSSGSSDPSIRSGKSNWFSDRASSISSVNTGGYAHFGEAARASGQDLSQLTFKMPSKGRASPAPSPSPSFPSFPSSSETASLSTGAGVAGVAGVAGAPASKPGLFSILIICPQTHSREATAQHIESTLPKDRPRHITAVATVGEAQKLIWADHAEPFTHVVVNLPSPQEILELVDQLDRSKMLETANVLVLSDSVQRQAVNKLAAGTRYEQRLSEARVMYIYKPVKPSRFAVIFDPERESDISIDRNRSSARRLVENQKQSYVDLEQRMGNKGYKVLLVEDNMVNQKVLKKYLQKVGVDVDMAVDGVECTDTVLSRPHDYYSLILCDLHMPRKDGYQACREIRAWEAENGHTKPIPIIALSANVMSDVHDKCVEAGFSKYITKPVDFIVLSHVLAEFF